MKGKISLFSGEIDLSAVQQQWDRITSSIRPADAFLIGISTIALVTSVFVDIFWLRLLCVAVIGISLVFVYRSVRALYGSAAPFRQQFEKEEMKKLVFDDFQSGSVERYEEKATSDGNAETQIPLPPVTTGSSVSAAPHNFKILKPEVKPVVREFHVGDFFDVDSDIFKGESEPRTEFDFLLGKVLVAIKETVFAHSVVFFWANREKQQMVIEARVTDSAQFMSLRRFPIGHDLVSKVSQEGKPELVTEVNPLSERELFPYYDTPPGVKSFVGVPVFFSQASSESEIHQPVAVIAVDSNAEGAFGDETVTLLGQFTKLISALIKNYTNKYDLLVESEVLSSVRRMQERYRSDFSQTSILDSLAEGTLRLVNYDFLSIVLFDDKKRAWVAKKVINRLHEPYIAPEQVVDFSESVVGRTIKNTMHYIVDNLETMTLPRYHKEEQAVAKGSFISVPICAVDKCYGALNVESRAIGSLSRQDVEHLHRLCETAALALDILFKKEVITEYVIIDDTTGVYSKKFFLQRMDEELQRADDSGEELSLLMVAVDHANDLVQRFGTDGFDRVVATLAKAIRSSVRMYDMVGRIEQSKFGVLLMNTAANDSYLWAEKIRKNVAAHVIAYEGKNFSVTISVGVAGAMDGMKKEELLVNTKAVLQKAAEAGGNAVRVF